ncbi:sulfhydryl oxidase 1 [Tribolium castaneum]|uniref:sulfhydryl oxidase 1 n=1 Tax=Tribolium castaneum TaxID=7070 RepID=UPI0030FEBDFE
MKSILAVVFLGLVCTKKVPSRVLYFPSDDVESLNVHNFKRFVENSPTAWLVTFYAKWCAHSQKFSTIWKQFASEATPWRDLVRVGVVDCSSIRNMRLCDKFKIVDFPNMKYFHEKSSFGASYVGLEVQVGVTLDFTKRFVFKTIVDEIMKGGGRIYPRGLVPYPHTDSTALFAGENANSRIVVWVIEDFVRPLGAEMVMHFHRTPNVAFKRSQAKALIGFPKVVFAERGKNLVIVDKNIDGSFQMMQVISGFLKSKGITPCVITPVKMEEMYSTV